MTLKPCSREAHVLPWCRNTINEMQVTGERESSGPESRRVALVVSVVHVAIATCLAGSKCLLYARGKECDVTRLRALNTCHKPLQQVFPVRKVRDEKPQNTVKPRFRAKTAQIKIQRLGIMSCLKKTETYGHLSDNMEAKCDLQIARQGQEKSSNCFFHVILIRNILFLISVPWSKFH